MKTRRKEGFTLLEVLLAVTILAIVVGTVYKLWSTSLTAWKRGTVASETAQRQRIVMENLTELTRSAVLIPSEKHLYELTGTSDEGVSIISFVTASNMLLPANEALLAGMRRVRILMETDEYGRPFLGMLNEPVLAADNAEPSPLHVLSADVVGFAVRFRNSTDGTWQEFWEDETKVPGAVEYTVAFANGQQDPIIVTRAIELPGAEHMTQALGGSQNKNNNTNAATTTRHDISTLGGSGAGGNKTGSSRRTP